MADTIDEVQGWNELHLEVSLKNQALRAAAENAAPEGFDGVHCVDCEEEIEPERQRLQLIRCAGCAHMKDAIDRARRRSGRSDG